ncbi:MAG: ClpXP protease specificity-enhancing factor SspB [Acidobacteriota bacterium]
MHGGIDYQTVMEEALQGVVRRLLDQTARDGLPGDHHFYIGFRTADTGVEMPASLSNRYPKEMTIVLQREFWGLVVDDAGFSVTLRFSGKPADLRVPFAALTSFVDPSVPFGLRFDFELGGDPAATDTATDDARTMVPPVSVLRATGAPSAGQVVSIDEFRRKD